MICQNLKWFGFLVIAAIAVQLSAAPVLTQSDSNDFSVLELRLAEQKPGDGLTELTGKDGASVYVAAEVIIQETDIESAVATVNERMRSKVVSVRLTKEGAKKLGQVSEANIGKSIAIIVEGELISAPVINSKLGRVIEISGRFSNEEVETIVAALQPGPRSPSFKKEALSRFAKRMEKAGKNGVFNGTILIAVDGEIVFEKSVGYSNVKDKTPFTERSSFRLASVSKQFTAMGIMILKEDGKLDFDDDISSYLSDLPYKGVTIRNLLHHTGGLADYMSLFDKHWDNGKSGADKKVAVNADLVQLFATHKPAPEFESGKRHQYSNTGFVLLGSIIEKASGMPIHEFFQKRIFEPLAMKDSHVFSAGDDFKPIDRVYGYADIDDGYMENDHHYLNGMVGDGGIYASARDLLKWDQALYGEKLVSSATLSEAFTSGKTTGGREFGYGFGWLVANSKSRGLTVSHGGSWVGFRTSIERQVDRKLTVIVLTNNSTSKLEQVLQAIDEL